MGETFPEFPQDRGQEVPGGIGGAGEAQGAAEPGVDIGQVGAGFGHLEQHRIRAEQQTFAGRRQAQAASGAVKELAAHVLFQLPQGVTDGALGEAEMPGGFGKTAGAGQGGKHPQLP